MKRLLWGAGVAVVLIISNSEAWAIGPSFDCNKAQSPEQLLICASPELPRTELEYVQAYYAMRQEVGEAGWQALKVDAITAENDALKRCGVPLSGPLPLDIKPLADCLGQAFQQLRANWIARLNGPAAEEARRPIEQHVALQRDLQALGYLPASAAIDGVYGSGTRGAIAAWQQAQHEPATGFLSDQDSQALAAQGGNNNLSSPSSLPDISRLSCNDIVGASQEALIPIVGAEIKYMQRRYPDLTMVSGSLTQTSTPEAIQEGKEFGAFVKVRCNQPGEQNTPLSYVLDSAAGLIRAGQLEAWLAQHPASPGSPPVSANGPAPSPPGTVPPAYTCGLLNVSARPGNEGMRPGILALLDRQIQGMGGLETAAGLPHGTPAERQKARNNAIGGLLTVCASGGVAPTAPLSVWFAMGWIDSLAAAEGRKLDATLEARAVEAWQHAGATAIEQRAPATATGLQQAGPGMVEQPESPPQALPSSSPSQSLSSNIPLQEEGGTLVVPVLINNAITLNFVVDSGAADVSIPADVFLTLMRAGTVDDSDFLGSRTYELADGTQVPSQTFRIRVLKVGDLEIDNVTASIGEVTSTLLLGESFLSRFKSWSIDNQRKHPPSAAVLHGRRPSMRTTHWCRLPLEVREEFLEVLDTFGGKGNGGHFVDVPDGEDTVFRLHIEGDVAQEVLVLAEHLGHPADGGDGTGRRH